MTDYGLSISFCRIVVRTLLRLHSGFRSADGYRKRKEREMKPIELERWEPAPDDPRRKVYAGQRTAQEVFEELRYRKRPGDPPRRGDLLYHRLRRQRGDLYRHLPEMVSGRQVHNRELCHREDLGGKRFRPGPDVPYCLRHH